MDLLMARMSRPALPALLALLLGLVSPGLARADVHTSSEEDSVSIELPEAKVKGKRRDAAPVEVKSDFIRKIPSAMNDPIRAATYAPGVMVQNDVNIRPLVRGGDADQTQVVMNGIPILHAYHVGGVFSVFNLSTLESVELHRDDFPVEYPGALSGVLRLKARRPSLSESRLKASLSMVRGDMFAEIPVVADRLSVYGGAQGFLFNKTLHGLLDLTSTLSRDSVFQQDIQIYQNHINLPEFQDYHWGVSHLSAGGIETAYAGSLSADDYSVVVPKQMNVIRSAPRPTDNPIPVVPVVPKKEITRSKKFSVDSISSVDIGNQTHMLSVLWDLGSRNYLENNFGYQTQREDVAFKKGSEAAGPLSLSQSSQFFNYRLSETYTPSRDHRFRFGLGYDYKQQQYDIDIPYVLYDVIVNGNMDMLEPLGLYSDAGFTIAKEDTALSNFDYLAEYPSRIRFSHKGRLEEHFGSVFLSHAYETSSGTLTYGVRGEYQSTSKEFFPSPRADYRWRLAAKDELLLTAGLYSQNNIPFYERDRNLSLKSEKSAQTGLEWTHRFSPGYRAVVGNYYKRYFDLVVPTLAPNHTLDLDALLLPHPGSTRSPEDIQALRSILDTAANFAALPDSVKQASYETFGGLIFDYANTGTGHSLGAEISFHYNPFPAWAGWLSADLSLSERRDAEGRSSYPYRYHRPVVVNWVNYFSMPSHYDISLTYRWALGQPYTPYTGALDGKGSLEPISVGARNSGRLSPFSRLDLRLARNSRWGSANIKAYVEVWNSMNSPNYFSRDDRTGELKSAQLNWPFPMFFLGLAGEL